MQAHGFDIPAHFLHQHGNEPFPLLHFQFQNTAVPYGSTVAVLQGAILLLLAPLIGVKLTLPTVL